MFYILTLNMELCRNSQIFRTRIRLLDLKKNRQDHRRNAFRQNKRDLNGEYTRPR